MSILKAIQPSLHLPNPSPAQRKTSRNRRRSVSGFCSSNDAGHADSSSPSEGDKRKQELLARIAMLQAQKVRLTDFLDERSAFLTQFAEDANAEFDQIGENALKELDEASARVSLSLSLKPRRLLREITPALRMYRSWRSWRTGRRRSRKPRR